MGRWDYGELVVRREVLSDGRPWQASPVRVVEDSVRWLVTYLPSGAPLEFPEGCFPTESGRHPWDPGAGGHRWEGHGVLMVQRPGEHYACWHFWEASERRFAGWYLNLQEAFRRTPIGYDTQDLELDVVIDLDGTWRFKDRELLQRRVEEGRFTAEEVGAILTLGDRIADDLDAGRRWWGDRWVDWEPDPEWGAASLPSGWEHVAVPERMAPGTP